MDTEWLAWTSAADTVKEGTSVEIKAAVFVGPAGTMGVLGRVPVEARGDARGSPCLASCRRCAQVRGL